MDRRYEIMPKPPIDIGPQRIVTEYQELYYGLRREDDPVTWLTTSTDIKKFLGLPDPGKNNLTPEYFDQARVLVEDLFTGSQCEPLIPEMMYALGFGKKQIKDNLTWDEHLDFLLVNGRHLPEPLLYRMADNLRDQGKKVAVVNFIGHYDDDETRIVGLRRLFHKVDKMVILASTHERYGGSVSLLANTIRVTRNKHVAKKVGGVEVVFPMLGSSRSDKDGQPYPAGYEIHQAKFDAKLLALTTNDVLKSLAKKLEEAEIPSVRFSTVDIHGQIEPVTTINKNNFEFLSACPSTEFANAVCRELDERDQNGWNGNTKLKDLSMKVVVFDNGGIPRSERFAHALLCHPDSCYTSIDVVYVDKTRVEAGKVKEAKVSKIERWTLLPTGEVHRKVLEEHAPTSEDPSYEECVISGFDDINASGGTSERNDEAVRLIYRNVPFKIDAYTHMVASQGVVASINSTGADVVLVGNTLMPPKLTEDPRVRVVDMTPAILSSLGYT